jgi:CrcB protein
VVIAVLVFLGGGLGAVLRWSVGLVVDGWWGVLVANIVGSFLLGLLVASPLWGERHLMAFLGTGLLGGFTTYSTFNVNVLDAITRQAWPEVGLQLGLTLAGCLVGGGLGLWIGSMLPR